MSQNNKGHVFKKFFRRNKKKWSGLNKHEFKGLHGLSARRTKSSNPKGPMSVCPGGRLGVRPIQGPSGQEDGTQRRDTRLLVYYILGCTVHSKSAR